MDKNRTNTQQYNHPNQKDLRRQLRKGGEAPEAVLWTLLKNRQIEGMKFRRQFGVGPYILDFYCPEIKLGVELDGAHHFMSSNFDYDDVRTKYLFQEHGIRIIRFENRTLFYNTESVVESIIKVIKKLKENNNNKPLRPTDTSPKTGEE
jgi:very-short-patch-repair endonuclease